MSSHFTGIHGKGLQLLPEPAGTSNIAVAFDDEPAGQIRLEAIRPSMALNGVAMLVDATDSTADDSDIDLRFRHPDQDLTAAIRLSRQGGALLVGELSAAGKGHGIIRLIWELPRSAQGFAFIPAFMYGRNTGGKSPHATYPQLGQGGRHQPWISPEWFMRTDRSSHGSTSVIANNMHFALGGRDVCRYPDSTVAEKTGLGISDADPHHRLTFSLGFCNRPITYSPMAGTNFVTRPEGHVNFDHGDVVSPFFLFAGTHQHRLEGADKITRTAYSIMRDQVNDFGTFDDAIISICDTLVDDCYCEKAKNFHTSISSSPSQPRNTDFCVGWCSGLEVAYPLLRAGHRYKNERWLNCARTVTSNIAENALNKQSRMFFDNYDITKDEWNCKGWWWPLLEKVGHGGYTNGHVCHYLLLAYILEKEASIERTEWLKAATDVLEHVASEQTSEGGFAYLYRQEDGKVLDPDGFAACWFTPAFISLFHITGEEKYLDIARRAMDFYQQYIERFDVYGCPMDTFKSPDSEATLAWIVAARQLHEITGEQKYLHDLLNGLTYEFSWKFSYNVVNELEPLKSLNWGSTGGTVTSINNAHIHPMSCAITDSMLYAVEQTGDSYIRSRLIDTVRWALTCYARIDRQYGWAKKGMVSERFCYTDSLQTERFADGSPASTWFACHAWAAGSVLEGLAGNVFDAVSKNKVSILRPSTSKS